MSEGLISIAVFTAVMVLIISEKVHRSVAAVLGAAALLFLGVLDVKNAAGHIDFNTIGVLVGMMLFVASVKRSGIFEYLAVKAAKAAGGDPWKMMVFFILITAGLSAFLDNVTTVLLVGPMAIAIAERLRLDPIPFLMTQILAANIGGTATLIGDPPNIMIGSAAGLGFMDFIRYNGPIIVIILAVTILCFKLLYSRQLCKESHMAGKLAGMDAGGMIKDKMLAQKCVMMMGITMTGFLVCGSAGVETSVVALAAASVMLIFGGQPFEEVIRDVEWGTIVFFTGLFVVVGALVDTGVIGELAVLILDATEGRQAMAAMMVLWLSALLSSTLDNIPYVATMLPLITALGESGMEVTPLWWALSLGACLGGNGTLIGASANVVLAAIGEKHGYPITYKQFLKIGFPLMLLSVALATAYLLIMGKGLLWWP